MPEVMQKSWVTFKIGKVGETSYQPLTRTGHATYVESALEVFREGRIRAKLVLHGSCLDRRKG